MRKLSFVALALTATSLVACSDSSTGSTVYRVQGTLDASGFATVTLPSEVGTPQRLPALTCYTASPT